MRARACIKCRMYVVVHPSDPTNQKTIGLFEDNHVGHNLVTLDLDEIQDTYQNFESVQTEGE